MSVGACPITTRRTGTLLTNLLRTAKTGCQVRVVGIGLVRGRVCSGQITRSW
jgi:hypothetical protein